MNLPLAEIKQRLADRYTAAELADAIDLDSSLFLDYFLTETMECIDSFDIEEELNEQSTLPHTVRSHGIPE